MSDKKHKFVYGQGYNPNTQQNYGPKFKKRRCNQHPKIMDELSDFLKSKGHSCVKISSKNTFTWCQKDVCPETSHSTNVIIVHNTSTLSIDLMAPGSQLYDDAKKLDDEQECRMQQLRTEGHTCIIPLETLPVQFMWCECNPCKDKQ